MVTLATAVGEHSISENVLQQYRPSSSAVVSINCSW